MRVTLIMLFAQPLISVAFSGPDAPWVCWKREGLDSLDRITWTDSVFFDSAGKPLQERLRDGKDSLLYRLLHGYDREGRHVTVAAYPQGSAEPESASCLYDSTGSMRQWHWRLGEDAENLMLPRDWENGDSVMYRGKARYRFRSAGGRCARVGRKPQAGNDETEGDFFYDHRGRHVASEFRIHAGAYLGRDTVLRDTAGRPAEWVLRDGRDSIVRRTTWTWSPEGRLLERAEFRDSAASLGKERWHWRALDSAPRVVRARSRFAGARNGPACSLVGSDMLDLGIEPHSMEGLELKEVPRGRGHVRRMGKSAAPSVFRDREEDSCMRMQPHTLAVACRARAESLAVAALTAPLGGCLKSKDPACTDTLAQAAAGLLDSAEERNGESEVFDSLTAALLRFPGGDTRLLALLRWEGQRYDLATHVLDIVIERRKDAGYAAFLSSPVTARLPKNPPPWAKLSDSASVPPLLRAAWAYRERVLAIDSGRSLEAEWEEREDFAVEKGAVAFLRGGGQDAFDGLHPTRSGSYGNGFEYGLAANIHLLADLDAGRLGAALRKTPEPEMIRKMLASRGLDWEKYLLGYLADTSNDGRRSDYLLALARSGSADAVRGILSLHRPGGPMKDYGSYYAAVLGILILSPESLPQPEGSEFYRARDEGPLGRDSLAPALPAALRDMALDRLKAQVDRNLLDAPLAEILTVIGRARFPGREAYLARIATVPIQSLRDSALAYLRAEERPRSLTPTAAVRFRLTSGGRPIKEVGCMIALEQAGETDRNRTVVTRTGWDGDFSVDRMAYLRLRGSGGRFHIANLDRIRRDEPLFSAPIDLPEQPSGRINIEIPLHRVVVTPVLPKGFFPFQEALAHVSILAAVRGTTPIGYAIPWNDSLVMPAWGDGAYTLEIALPGLRREIIGPIRVAGGDVRLAPALARGADVIVKVHLPADDSVSIKVIGVSLVDREGRVHLPDQDEGGLLWDFVWFPAIPATFCGLRPGEYTLRVLSSRELRAELGSKDASIFAELGRISPERFAREYRGFSLPVRISPAGPDELDLGVVRLLADAVKDVVKDAVKDDLKHGTKEATRQPRGIRP